MGGVTIKKILKVNVSGRILNSSLTSHTYIAVA
jgi:hypothetical protein